MRRVMKKNVKENALLRLKKFLYLDAYS